VEDRPSTATLPAPFLAAREALDPVIKAGGYRFVGLETWGSEDDSALAEYRGHGRRLRVVYEALESSLWVDTATERDTQIVSRWIDIEWLLAGKRLEPNFEVSEDRIGALVTAAARFMVTNDLPPAPGDSPPIPE
jgi:hypothetical protein